MGDRRRLIWDLVRSLLGWGRAIESARPAEPSLGGAIARIEHLIDLVEILPVTYPEIVEIASGIYADWRSPKVGSWFPMIQMAAGGRFSHSSGITARSGINHAGRKILGIGRSQSWPGAVA